MNFAHAYARAFFESLPAGYDTDRFLEAAATLCEVVEKHRTARAFLAAPAVPYDAKRKALEALSARAGLDDFGSRFFELVLKNHRILDTGPILRSLRDGNDARKGILQGRVTVAAPIADPERARIEEAVAARVGGKVRLGVEVDPTILAGFVARVGSSVFDASAAAAIRRFQTQAKERTGA